jgi:baseplate J-like protein
VPVVIQSRPDDEIADLIERVRSSKDRDVGLVIPPGSRGLQTPLSARLLGQFCRQSGRRTAIVSDDQRVQELARANGFTVYASVLGYERGIELVPAPSHPAAPADWNDTGAATAVQDGAPRMAGTAVATAAPPPTRLEPRRILTVPPPKSPRFRDRRRILYFAGAGVGVVGLLLFFTLAPSAKITLTVSALPLSVSPVIQGSTDPNQAHQGDHVLTAVVSSTATGQFNASPTGQKTLPATSATGTIVFSTDAPFLRFTVPKGNAIENADGSIVFAVTQDTFICISGTGTPPTAAVCGQPPNSTAPVQAVNAGAAGNAPTNSLTVWPSNPCPSNAFCGGQGYHLSETNPQAATGGADPKQVVIASTTDVAGWTNQVQQIENQLTTQVNDDMRTKANGKSFAVDPSGSGKTIAFTVNPPLPTANDQYAQTQITVTANAKAAVYDPNDVKNAVKADLQAQVPQGDELAADKLSISPPSVTQAADDGTVVLSVSGTGYGRPIIDLKGLKGQLTGKSPGDARKIISNRIDHVQSVAVSEFPFTLFYLPFFADRIEIDENFVPTPQSSQPQVSPQPTSS